MARSIQIVFDCAVPAAQARFWAAALGYEPPPPPDGFGSWEDWLRANNVPPDEWGRASALVDPEGVGPRIYFQRVPEGKTAKNRVHIDVQVTKGRDVPPEERRARVDAEVERLKALGASDARGPMEELGTYWVRMNDPEGNEFCVV